TFQARNCLFDLLTLFAQFSEDFTDIHNNRSPRLHIPCTTQPIDSPSQSDFLPFYNDFSRCELKSHKGEFHFSYSGVSPSTNTASGLSGTLRTTLFPVEIERKS